MHEISANTVYICKIYEVDLSNKIVDLRPLISVSYIFTILFMIPVYKNICENE